MGLLQGPPPVLVHVPLDEGGPLPAPLVRLGMAVMGGRGRPADRRRAGGAGGRDGGGTSRRAWGAPVVVIDGRSGSGKTSLAGMMAQALRTGGVRGLQVAHLDDWYPEWHGLAAGTAITERLLLGTDAAPTGRAGPAGPAGPSDSAGLSGSADPSGSVGLSDPAGPSGSAGPPPCPWQGRARLLPEWDWVANRVRGQVALDPDRPLLVEGSGALTARVRDAADLCLWVEVDPARVADEAAERRRRALDRDGDGFRPWWDMWAGQEVTHLALHHPRALADVVVQT